MTLDDVAFFNRALSQPEITSHVRRPRIQLLLPHVDADDHRPRRDNPIRRGGVRGGRHAPTAIAGPPLAGKTLVLTDPASGNTATLTTDADGTVRWVVLSDRAAGTYASRLTASFPGDAVYAAAIARATARGGMATRGSRAIPASITYGTPLSSVQLNATAASPERSPTTRPPASCCRPGPTC